MHSLLEVSFSVYVKREIILVRKYLSPCLLNHLLKGKNCYLEEQIVPFEIIISDTKVAQKVKPETHYRSCTYFCLVHCYSKIN